MKDTRRTLKRIHLDEQDVNLFKIHARIIELGVSQFLSGGDLTKDELQGAVSALRIAASFRKVTAHFKPERGR